MNPFGPIDKLLNQLTMYRLMAYGLGLLVAVSLLFGFMGDLPFSGWSMLVSLGVISAACYSTNRLLARVWDAAYVPESSLITALILFLILPADLTAANIAGLLAAGVLAIASKYILVRRRRHLFNPAAIGVLLVGVTGLTHATWWIASSILLPFTALFGLLILRKLRRFQVFAVFAATALLVMLVVGLWQEQPNGEILAQAFTSWPLIFLGTVMLTEPATLPARFRQQVGYAALVGAVFASQVDLGPVAATPEVALILGNIFSSLVSPGRGLRLRLVRKVRLSPRIYEFVFQPDGKLDYLPGQYMAWTMPYDRSDDRGNRRSFTVASSPTEETVRLGVKFYQPSSTFKTRLQALEPGATLTAGQLSGDFVLPGDTATKLVFIAGGIGVTPFRSMAKYIADKQEQRDIVLFHVVSDAAEAVYQDIWSEASAYGLRVVTVLDSNDVPDGWKGLAGPLTVDAISRQVPDYRERRFYVSGPNAMVDSFGRLLRKAGVRRVFTDHFSGY